MKLFNCFIPRRPQWWGWLCASLLGGAALAASAAVDFDDPGEQGWFVRAGGRALFNVKASVSRLAAPVVPGVYDDGFVLPDVSQGPLSWNWGYQDDSQLSGTDLRLERLTDVPVFGLYNQETSNPSYGGEIMAGMEFVRFFIGRREARFGFEIGYGYNSFSLKNSSTATGVATLTTDTFDVSGITVPLAPYAGTVDGPGPLIGTVAASSNPLTSPSRAQSRSKLESNLHNFKAGFWLEYPVARKMIAGLSLGYSSLYADTQYTFTEGITYDNFSDHDIAPTQKTIGGRAWKAGAYTQLRLHYQISRRLAAYLGGDFQYNKKLTLRGEGREITLDFRTLFAASLGLVLTY